MNAAAPTSPKPIQQSYLLVGEGVEECLFFTALLGVLKISSVQVERYDGKDKLRVYLAGLAKRPGFAGVKAVAITRDADDNPDGALNAVRNAIRDAGFPSNVNTHYFILPAAKTVGALEDLCLEHLKNAQINDCLEQFFACAGRLKPRDFETRSIRAKARIHAWLSTLEEPDLRLGEAARKHIDWNHAAFDDLKQFLKTAFA